jgi:hypothetical protein
MDAPTDSLYDRLGGIYSIATVVDDFIDRIMVDERLNSNPRVDEAHHRVLPPGFKYLVTEMLGQSGRRSTALHGSIHGGKPSRVADNPGGTARLHG